MFTGQDLDNPDAIAEFIQRFYAKVLDDPQLAPIFLDAAGIDIDHHLELITAFWRKLLLGEQGYDRHMMNIHRAVHERHAFSTADFQRWLGFFETTLNEGHQGKYTERARQLANSIATNLHEALLAPDTYVQRTRPIDHSSHS